MTAWIDVIGWTLLHFVWEGTLIALFTALALTLLRQASAHLRYAIACAALLLALAAVVATPAALLAMDGQLSPVAARVALIPQRILTPVDRQATLAIPAPVTPAAAPSGLRGMDAALSVFVVCWAAGVLLLTLRLGIGWWRVRRLHLEALAAPASEWLGLAMKIAATLDLRRVIHVVDSDDVETPTVIGWLRPVVLLPIAALANLSPGQVQAILAHELAHVQRHDFIVNLLQTIAETVLFYHPGVWWLSARIRAERELCCDDVAVQVCGDPVGYAEALTALASWAQRRTADAATRRAASSLAVAATGGSLLHRVRRLLHLPVDSERRRPRAPFVIAATVLLIVLVGGRLLVVAQVPPLDDPRLDRRLGPLEVNRLLGVDLFPGPAHYASDDPRDARAWDVKVRFPGGEMSFLGFTGRGLIRYAYDLDGMPVVDGPSWLDTQPNELVAETSTVTPTDFDYREAIRVALEGQYRISIRHESRLFPVYGLQPVSPGRLGPNIRPAAADCVEGIRQRPDLVGPSLHGRGQMIVPLCGIDHSVRGPKGYRVTLAEFARSLRGFTMGPAGSADAEREVIDQTGMTGVYDFELRLGFLPLAAIATAHPAAGIGFGPMIRTFPQAIEEQLGLTLVRSEAPRDVVVIATAQQAFHEKADAPERRLARLRTDKKEDTVKNAMVAALTIAAAVAGPAMLAAQLPVPPGPAVDPNAQFEAASIKAFDSSGSGPIRMMMMPGRIEANGVPLRLLLRQALRVQDYQILGVPDWVNTERFTIVAKMPDGAQPNAAPVMLTNLFKDRFKLATHAETREMPIFNLVVARQDGKLGPSLKPTSAECQAEMQARRGGPPPAGPGGPGGPAAPGRGPVGPPPPPDFNQPSPCGMMRIGPGLGNASGQPVAQIVQMLAQFTGRPVYDKTGLTGQYDFDLKWAPDSGSAGPLGGPPPGAPALPFDPDAPNIYTAVQEQLGLKLENAKGPVDVVVIDRIERPAVD